MGLPSHGRGRWFDPSIAQYLDPVLQVKHEAEQRCLLRLGTSVQQP
jgi:hypothetical protein